MRNSKATLMFDKKKSWPLSEVEGVRGEAAFIFDLNGTMIDDIHYHAEAWYDILNHDLDAGLTWDEVRALKHD